MVHTFSTIEQAYIFAAQKRDEGFYAEVLDESTSALWGPAAVNGVRVIVSESQGEDRQPLPEQGLSEKLLGIVANLLFYGAIFVYGGLLCLAIIQSPYAIFSWLVATAVLLFFYTLSACLVKRFLSSLESGANAYRRKLFYGAIILFLSVILFIVSH